MAAFYNKYSIDTVTLCHAEQITLIPELLRLRSRSAGQFSRKRMAREFYGRRD
jgi:hypothetical protein